MAQTREALSTLQFRLRMMANSADEPVHIFSIKWRWGQNSSRDIASLDDFRSSNNLQTSTMIAVIGHWRQTFPKTLRWFTTIVGVSRDRDMWRSRNCRG